MASIGFELKRMLSQGNFIGAIGAYTYAGLVASGPWLIAIVTILFLSQTATNHLIPTETTSAFKTIVVYLISGSLICSSVFQHTYTRYIADECFLKRQNQIIPSLNSIYATILLFGGIFAHIAVHFLLPDVDLELQLLIISAFVILCMIWVTTSVLSGLLAYGSILGAFVLNFVIAFSLGFFLYPYGLAGLILSFIGGQFFLLMVLIYTIYKNYPADELINFNFFRQKKFKYVLIFTGLFYNLAIWIDKYIFWYRSLTGEHVIGYLNQSFIYDTPVFMAYLAIIPGMIVLLFNMETSFSDAYFGLYDNICSDATLAEIQESFHELIYQGRLVLFRLIKSQICTLVVAITIGVTIFTNIRVPTIYVPLFCICLVAASLNIIFWMTLDIVFYLDKLWHAALLSFVFFISNAVFTWISIDCGIFYFGYGLVASLLLTVILSFILLDYEFKHLMYQTYMLSPII